MPNKAAKLAEAKRSVIAEAKRKVAARKAASGGSKKKPAAKVAAPKRTRGITNIIKRRSTQANRAVKKALGGG